MAWIESHQELADHPKTRKLANILGTSIPAAIGHLHLLWWWAVSYAEDGDLTDFDAYDIASAARYDDDPDTFVKALINCGPGNKPGFLDGDMKLHDWWDYTAPLRLSREAGREGNHKRWHVQRRRIDPDCPWCPDVAPESGSESPPTSPPTSPPIPHVGNPPTQPNPTQPNPTASAHTPARAKRSLPTDWQPNTTHQSIAAELHRDLPRESADFRDDATANDRRYKDWDAAFRKWLRNERYRPARASPNGTERLTAAEQRTQRNRETRQRAIEQQRQQGMQ